MLLTTKNRIVHRYIFFFLFFLPDFFIRILNFSICMHRFYFLLSFVNCDYFRWVPIITDRGQCRTSGYYSRETCISSTMTSVIEYHLIFHKRKLFSSLSPAQSIVWQLSLASTVETSGVAITIISHIFNLRVEVDFRHDATRNSEKVFDNDWSLSFGARQWLILID